MKLGNLQLEKIKNGVLILDHNQVLEFKIG